MSRKKTLIKKDVFLYKIERDELKEYKFNQVYKTEKNYSLEIDGYIYYCRSDQNYYVTNNYCLIIDEKHKKEAVKELVSSVKKHLTEQRIIILNQLEKLNQKVEKWEKLS